MSESDPFTFDFAKEREERASAAMQENQSGASAVADATRLEANQAAADALQRSRRRRRSRQAATDRGADSEELRTAIATALREQLDAINSPEAWEALLTLPAHSCAFLTGNLDRWTLSDKEAKTLGMTGSAAGKTLMITNPRLLAFAMLSAALVAIYGPRAAKELREMALKRKTAETPKPAT